MPFQAYRLTVFLLSEFITHAHSHQMNSPVLLTSAQGAPATVLNLCTHPSHPWSQFPGRPVAVGQRLLASTLDLLADYHGDSNQTPKSTGLLKLVLCMGPRTARHHVEKEREVTARCRCGPAPSEQAAQQGAFNRVKPGVCPRRKHPTSRGRSAGEGRERSGSPEVCSVVLSMRILNTSLCQAQRDQRQWLL